MTYIVPELRLGNEYKLAVLEEIVACGVFGEGYHILSPNISEAAETKTLYTKEVLHAPYEGELQRQAACGSLAEGFVEDLEIEGVAETAVVQEIVYTEEEILARETDAAIVLNLCAEGSDSSILPEIQAPGNLKVTSACKSLGIRSVGSIVIVVDKEESVAPSVDMKAFEGCSEMSAT